MAKSYTKIVVAFSSAFAAAIPSSWRLRRRFVSRRDSQHVEERLACRHGHVATSRRNSSRALASVELRMAGSGALN